jgi:hypothetical protein
MGLWTIDHGTKTWNKTLLRFFGDSWLSYHLWLVLAKNNPVIFGFALVALEDFGFCLVYA